MFFFLTIGELLYTLFGMRIELKKVGEIPLEIEKTFEYSDEYIDAPVLLTGTIEKHANSYRLSAVIKGTYNLKCSLCLKPFKRAFEIPLELIFQKRKMRDEKEYELTDSEMDIVWYDEPFIELLDFVKSEIVLNRPYKAVCSDNCKGLCPVCGADLNEGDCGCNKEIIDDRLSVLAKLKSELYGGE